jgi:RNA polymerase sigma-70 factor (ECF subfamily)
MLLEWNDEEHQESEERIAAIMKLIDEMQEPTHTIMEQCYLYKKKYKEVAQMVGLTESGVRKHIMKGLDKIRAFFNVKYKKGGSQNYR